MNQWLEQPGEAEKNKAVTDASVALLASIELAQAGASKETAEALKAIRDEVQDALLAFETSRANILPAVREGRRIALSIAIKIAADKFQKATANG
jgi:hypothetical protein